MFNKYLFLLEVKIHLTILLSLFFGTTHARYISYHQHINVTPAGYELSTRISGIADNQSEQIEYRSFEKIENLVVEYKLPGKSKYKKLAKNYITRGEAVTSSFYSDIKQLTLDIPRNASFKITFTKVGDDPVFLSILYFAKQKHCPVSTYTIHVSDSLKLHYKLPEKGIILTKTEKEFLFKRSAEVLEEAQYVRIFICPVGENPKTFFAKWYLQKLENINTLTNKHIAFLDTLATGKTSVEIITALYQYTQQKIRYIDYEDGYGAVIPRPASNVYGNGYGDCKDMAFFLNQSLSYLNIPSNLALSASTSHFCDLDFISMGSANHCICVVPKDSGYYYLDATDKLANFGEPSIHTQGKHLFIIEPINPRFQYVEPWSAEANKEKYTFQIDPKNKLVHFTLLLKGKSYDLLRIAYSAYSTYPEENRRVSSLYSFIAREEVAISSWEDYGDSIQINGAYPIENETIVIQGNVFVKLGAFDFLKLSTPKRNENKSVNYYRRHVEAQISSIHGEPIFADISALDTSGVNLHYTVYQENTLKLHYTNQNIITTETYELPLNSTLTNYYDTFIQTSIKIKN